MIAHLFCLAVAFFSPIPLEEQMKEVSVQITSTAFEANSMIPKKYTCQGQDVSPPLSFTNVPEDTVTLALIIDDPDAPSGVFDHWIAWNIPGDKNGLAEGEAPKMQGKNHFGETRYRGPCPPPGKPHHYRFKVYALDTTLDLKAGSSKKDLEKAMEGHILASDELVGIFQR